MIVSYYVEVLDLQLTKSARPSSAHFSRFSLVSQGLIALFAIDHCFEEIPCNFFNLQFCSL